MKRVTVLALLALVPRALAAQGVLVAPHAVFIDNRTRSGSLTLYNPGNDPVEVSVSTLFGYPVTDSVGNFELYTPDPPDSGAPSASAWLQAFPRRMTLQPRERQTLRLLGRPPADLPEGEYWSRLVVTAKGGQVPVAGIEDTTQIRVGLTLEVRTILPVYYRKGNPSTGITVRDLRGAIEGDSLVVRAKLERHGTGAFLGTVRGALIDSAGTTMATFKMPLAVFYQIEPRLSAGVGALLPGQYRLRLELSSEREDLASNLLLPITPVRDSTEVRVP